MSVDRITARLGLVRGAQGGAGSLQLDGAADISNVRLNPRDFGARGDGVTDDTVPLTNWLAACQGGALGEWPEGTYRITSGLQITGRVNILAVPGQTILAPAVGTGVALTLGETVVAYGLTSYLRGLTIDGSNDPAGTGLQLGRSVAEECVNLQCHRVEVLGFSDPGGVGIRVADCTDVRFYDCVSAFNDTNLLLNPFTFGLPTQILWDGGLIKFGYTGPGIDIRDGRNILFRHVDIAGHQVQAVSMVVPAGGFVYNIVFEDCWFEANYTSIPANFAITAVGTGGARSHLALVRCFYEAPGQFLATTDVDFVDIDHLLVASAAYVGYLSITGAGTMVDVRGWRAPWNNTPANAFVFAGGAALYGNVVLDDRSNGVNNIYGDGAVVGGNQYIDAARAFVIGANALRGGNGVPAVGLGGNGDFYIRWDGAPGTALYFKSGGAWAAIA